MPLMLDRHTPSPGSPELGRRVGWIAGVAAVMFLVLIGRLWQLQVIRGEQYYQRSTDNFVHEHRIPAVRGLIKDRKGVVLVDNRASFSVYVTPRYFTEDAQNLLVRLLGLTDAEKQAIVQKVDKARARDPHAQVLVLEDVSQDRLALIEQSHAELPGVDVHDAPHRNYLHGTLAAHVLGYMNELSGAELDGRRAEGYDDGDYLGRYGIEKEWENYLRGKKGREFYVVDAKNRRKSDEEAAELIEGERFIPPVPGHNVMLTIDVELQRIAERALRNFPAGGIAVVDVKTGKILAIVSKPAFDPNVMTGRLTKAEEDSMLADPYKPFLDKTLRQHYYPGSTYKFVTALAAIDDSVIGEDDKLLCKGWHELGKRSFRCTKAHGIVDMAQALAQSCNVYFWQLAEKVGIDRIGEIARDFGFGAPTGLALNGDVPGRVPWKGWYEKSGGFRIGYTLNTAVGQGDTEVTVLQLALAYAALANGGNLYIPQIVDRVETAEGKVVQDYLPRLRHRVQATSHAMAVVAHGMWGTVNDPKGTAYSARLANIEVAGKTGTAQVRKLRPQAGEEWQFRHHAWFAGYAPANAPEIAVVVLIEHGGHGGQVAAPVATEIVKGYFENVVQGGRPTNVAQVPLSRDGAADKDAPTPSGVEEVDEDVDDGVPAAVTGPQPRP
jgi:penicillin-binding protein 2